MGALANTSGTLASAVADAGTFTVSYPTGWTANDFRGTTGGKIAIGDDIYSQGADGVLFTFGASSITVTNDSGRTWAAGTDYFISFGRTDRNGSYNLTVGGDRTQAAAGDGSGPTAIQELTASGAVAAATGILELNHASVVIAATMDPRDHVGLFTVRDTSASGTAAHTLTLSSGTFNGTNTIATLNAPGESLTVFFDGNGRGTIIENTGSVGLSGP